jgi:NodT family efflux transporter outer membrane factor (OMF) lipoprotein
MSHSVSSFVRPSVFIAAATLALSGCSTDGVVSDSDSAMRATVKVPRGWHGVNPVASADGNDAQQQASESFFDAKPLVSPPESHGDKAFLTAWWSRFNDPVLDQIISTALTESPDLRTALSRITEARALRGSIESSLMPNINAGVGARHDYRRDHNVHRTNSGSLYTVGFDASWELDIFGRSRSLQRAAEEEVQGRIEYYRAAQISLAAEVADAYVHLRALEAQHSVVKGSIATQAETTRIIEWRASVGEASTLEVQQSTRVLEQMRADLSPLQRDIAQARNRLTILTGKAPGSLDELLAKAPDGVSSIAAIPAVPTNVNLALPAEVLRNRPDIRAAEKSVYAAAFRTFSAKSERYPTLNLAGAIGFEALKAGNLFSPDATVGSILGGLTAPLFDGWRISSNIEVKTEVQRQALIAYEAAVLKALGEVEDTLVAVERTKERLERLKTAAAAAAYASKLASLKYEAGQEGFTLVLDTQREQLSIEEQIVATTAENASAYIRLYKVVGGGRLAEEAQN